MIRAAEQRRNLILDLFEKLPPVTLVLLLVLGPLLMATAMGALLMGEGAHLEDRAASVVWLARYSMPLLVQLSVWRSRRLS